MPANSFPYIRHWLATQLLNAKPIQIGEWHSKTDDKLVHEVNDVVFHYMIPVRLEDLVRHVRPNLPWAEDHFQERVSGKPLNPPPSSEHWPFAQKNNGDHKTNEIFSHTYPERYWPKIAGHDTNADRGRNVGIRYLYGDLNDVVKLLKRKPMTRQAYLPVWFPEDTGVVHGERVPCSLGYHFLLRNGQLNCTYMMRSCDFVRHFQDDIYMTARLVQWICKHLQVWPGKLTTHIMNLHAFEDDRLYLMNAAKPPQLDMVYAEDGRYEDQ